MSVASEEEILSGVRAVLREELAQAGPLERDTDLQRDLALDSLQLLTLVVGLENRFRVAFDPGDEEGVATLGDVAALLRERLAASEEEA